MILVVGSINLDENIRVKAFPKPGETILAQGVTKSAGGQGANQAVATAKSGGDVVMLGCVGKDAAGDMLLASMEESGVNTEHILRTDSVPTSKAYITISQDGENQIMVDSSANWMVSKEYLESKEELFKEASYCILQLEIPDDTVYTAEQLCKKHGVKIVLNPSPIQSFDERLLQQVHTVVVNKTEGEVLTGLTQDQITEDTWNRFMETHEVQNVVQTLGSKGSVLYQKGEPSEFYPAWRCEAVDTTGAGDTFLGALIAMFSQKKSTAESFRYAAVASGLEVMKPGAQAAMPTQAEVLSNLK